MEIQRLIKRNVDTIIAQQRENGAINASCASRVLESALTLHLLQYLSILPSNQKRLLDYLAKATAKRIGNVHAVEGAICEVAKRLIGQHNASKSSSYFLDAIFSVNDVRKTLYFGCLIAEMKGVPFSELPFDVHTFQILPEKLQLWASLMLCCLKVMYCHGVSIEDCITEKEKTFLIDTLGRQAVFENYILIQVAGLIALSKLLPKKEILPQVEALLKWQQPDGGMPTITGLDTFVTPIAGIALLKSLPNMPKEQALAIQASIRQMGDYIASEQLADGGWPFMTGNMQSDADGSGLCFALLAIIDKEEYKTNLEKALLYKTNLQNTDGGFPTFLRGNLSTPSMTAAALHGIGQMLLRDVSKSFQWKDAIRKALLYLANSQKEEGTFEQRWSNAETHAMFRVTTALHAIRRNEVFAEFGGIIANIFDKIQKYLQTTQNHDGGWGRTSKEDSDVVSTAYAILCCNQSERELATKGIAFLLSHRDMDETIKYRPDLLGPRPILYDIPIFPFVIETYAYAYFLETFA